MANNDRAGRDGRQVFPHDPDAEKNARNRLPNDHEVVKPSHNNAQFRSIAGHAALG
jgi:hypothetical protein